MVPLWLFLEDGFVEEGYPLWEEEAFCSPYHTTYYLWYLGTQASLPRNMLIVYTSHGFGQKIRY